MLFSAQYVSTSNIEYHRVVFSSLVLMLFFFTPLFQVMGEWLIILSPLRSLRACPKPGTCYSEDVAVLMFKFYFFALFTYLDDSCYILTSSHLIFWAF